MRLRARARVSRIYTFHLAYLALWQRASQSNQRELRNNNTPSSSLLFAVSLAPLNIFTPLTRRGGHNRASFVFFFFDRDFLFWLMPCWIIEKVSERKTKWMFFFFLVQRFTRELIVMVSFYSIGAWISSSSQGLALVRRSCATVL